MTDLNGCLAMVGCSKATHRSTTLCMTVEAMYNSIVHGNHKLFNANHLRMIGDRPEEKLYDGYRWSYERAWSIFKLPPARYAQDSMTTGVMQGNFKKIWQLVEDINSGQAYVHEMKELARKVYEVALSSDDEAESDRSPPWSAPEHSAGVTQVPGLGRIEPPFPKRRPGPYDHHGAALARPSNSTLPTVAPRIQHHVPHLVQHRVPRLVLPRVFAPPVTSRQSMLVPKAYVVKVYRRDLDKFVIVVYNLLKHNYKVNNCNSIVNHVNTTNSPKLQPCTDANDVRNVRNGKTINTTRPHDTRN
jgi:hypothetical protein